MSNSIDNVIKNDVLYNIRHVESITDVEVEEGEKRTHSKLYIARIKGGTYFSFRINFEPKGLKYDFVETNITNLITLSSILNDLVTNLFTKQDIIKKYYYCHLKNTFQNKELIKFKEYKGEDFSNI